MNILIVTKSRSGYGAHVVLTAIIRELRKAGHSIEVMVSEHPLEAQKWSGYAHLWHGIEPKVMAFRQSLLTAAEPTDRPYAYTDDILLHDTHLVELLGSLPVGDYDAVLLDSWYLMYSAFISGIHLKGNVFQFVQSEPVFEPTVIEDEWKAAIFKLMPWVPAKRIFVSFALAKKFNREYSQDHKAIGFFLDTAFFNALHTPHRLCSRPLRVVSMASNFTIPSKGLHPLLEALETVHKLYPIELTLISTMPISGLQGYTFPLHIVGDATSSTKCAQVLAGNDVYATCTLNESPGLAQAEAIAVGLPSVAFDSGGNQDYYTGSNFLLTRTNDEFLLALILCLDDAIRLRLAAIAKQSMQHYSLQACISRLLQYLSLSTGKASGHRIRSVG